MTDVDYNALENKIKEKLEVWVQAALNRNLKLLKSWRRNMKKAYKKGQMYPIHDTPTRGDNTFDGSDKGRIGYIYPGENANIILNDEDLPQYSINISKLRKNVEKNYWEYDRKEAMPDYLSILNQAQQ